MAFLTGSGAPLSRGHEKFDVLILELDVDARGLGSDRASIGPHVLVDLTDEKALAEIRERHPLDTVAFV